MGQLSGKVVLLLGPASLAFEAVAALIVGQGASIFLATDDDAAIARVIGTLGHNRVDGKVVDVADWKSLGHALLAALRRFGGVWATVAFDPPAGDTRLVTKRTFALAAGDDLAPGGVFAAELLEALVTRGEDEASPAVAITTTTPAD